MSVYEQKKRGRRQNLQIDFSPFLFNLVIRNSALACVSNRRQLPLQHWEEIGTNLLTNPFPENHALLKATFEKAMCGALANPDSHAAFWW
jgi:hypothetical protein